MRSSRMIVGVLLLLLSHSLMRSWQSTAVVLAIVSTMAAAVAVGQKLLFGGRNPGGASIWVGACVFPLQMLAVLLWNYFFTPDLRGGWFAFTIVPLASIPLGAFFGYQIGWVVCFVSVLRQGMAQRQRSEGAAIEAAEPPEPTERRAGRGQPGKREFRPEGALTYQPRASAASPCVAESPRPVQALKGRDSLAAVSRKG